MKCVILVAGYATRLYPLTKNFPKSLLEVGSKTILDWLLDDLMAIPEINEHILISNHKFAEQFRIWSKTRAQKVTVVDDGTSTNETRMGAVKDIQFAIEQLQLDDDLLIMAGDNLLDFSLTGFVNFAVSKGTSCVMCHSETELTKQQKTAIITVDMDSKITSYEEKPQRPKGNLAVPPFYYYLWQDVCRIPEALEQGCNADAPGSFAAWLSRKTTMYAYVMPGKRYDIGSMESYEAVKKVFKEK